VESRAVLHLEGSDGSASAYPDSNVVIVLAMLLYILICALGPNSVVRCARLAMGAATTTNAMAITVTAAPAVVGLSKSELRMIPVVGYETSKAGALPGDRVHHLPRRVHPR
jgi:E3 ubiquitin-protein ligase ATL10/75/76/77/78